MSSSQELLFLRVVVNTTLTKSNVEKKMDRGSWMFHMMGIWSSKRTTTFSMMTPKFLHALGTSPARSARIPEVPNFRSSVNAERYKILGYD